MRHLILSNFNHQGPNHADSRVRDLHVTYPGDFVTDVRSPRPALLGHNSYVTPLRERDPWVHVLECHYPLIHRNNQSPYRFIHGFIEYHNDLLRFAMQAPLFCGDIPLSAQETSEVSPVEAIVHRPVPYWIVVAGDKRDFTAKWWDHQRYQRSSIIRSGSVLKRIPTSSVLDGSPLFATGYRAGRRQ